MSASVTPGPYLAAFGSSYRVIESFSVAALFRYSGQQAAL